MWLGPFCSTCSAPDILHVFSSITSSLSPQHVLPSRMFFRRFGPIIHRRVQGDPGASAVVVLLNLFQGVALHGLCERRASSVPSEAPRPCRCQGTSGSGPRMLPTCPGPLPRAWSCVPGTEMTRAELYSQQQLMTNCHLLHSPPSFLLHLPPGWLPACCPGTRIMAPLSLKCPRTWQDAIRY